METDRHVLFCRLLADLAAISHDGQCILYEERHYSLHSISDERFSGALHLAAGYCWGCFGLQICLLGHRWDLRVPGLGFGYVPVRFSTRIRTALNQAGMKTVGEIREASDATLLCLQDLGKGSVVHLRTTLGLPSKDGVRTSGVKAK